MIYSIFIAKILSICSLKNKLKSLYAHEVLNNTGWLLLDKGITLSVSFFVGVIIARYLGPSEFGNFSYCLSVIAVFSGISMLGWDRVIIRDLVQASSFGSSIIATHQGLKFLGASVAGFLAFIFVYAGPNVSSASVLVIILLSLANVFASFHAVDLFFLSKLETKIIVPIRITILIFSTTSRLLVIYLGGDIVDLAFVQLAEAVFLAFALNWKYKKITGELPFNTLNVDYAYKLIREGWPLFLGLQLDIFAQKIYGVALNGQMTEAEYGQFMLALRLIEIPLMLLYLSSTSFLPKLTALKSHGIGKLENKILFYTEMGTLLGVFSWVFIFFLGPKIVQFIFGEEYKDTGSLLVLFWGAVFFQANALFRAHFLTIQSSQITLLMGNFLSLFIAIPLAFFLIKVFGWRYAAVAFSLSSFVMYFLSGIVTSSGRRIMAIQINALTFPTLRNFIRTN
jgi:O-antigen/teichoic acid export membrane protein